MASPIATSLPHWLPRIFLILGLMTAFGDLSGGSRPAFQARSEWIQSARTNCHKGLSLTKFLKGRDGGADIKPWSDQFTFCLVRLRNAVAVRVKTNLNVRVPAGEDGFLLYQSSKNPEDPNIVFVRG